MKKQSVPVKCGESYDLKIDNINSQGQGIASVNGYRIFVDGAVPGDTVRAEIEETKKNYARARAVKVLSFSPERREEKFCPYEDYCGGCSYSALNYKAQLRLKEEAVVEQLRRIGGFKDLKVLPIIGARPEHYRNKVQLKVSPSELGLYKKRTHDLIEIKSCRLESEAINGVMPLLERIITDCHLSVYDENNHTGLLRGIVVRSNNEGELMVVFVINGTTLPRESEIVENLKADSNILSAYLNVHTRRGNKTMGEENICLFKRGEFREKLGDREFLLSPTSFFQVNTEQAKILYDIVKDYADIKEGECVYDLYCGTGTIGLYITDEKNKLIGIELNPEAVEDAKKNAAFNGIKNAKFLAGRAEVVTQNLDERPDCVILDPPRKGCDKNLIELLLKLKPERIVYVSCNPATLARDLKLLSQDYSIDKVQPVDLFAQTGHIETVTLLKRIDNRRRTREKRIEGF